MRTLVLLGMLASIISVSIAQEDSIPDSIRIEVIAYFKKALPSQEDNHLDSLQTELVTWYRTQESLGNEVEFNKLVNDRLQLANSYLLEHVQKLAWSDDTSAYHDKKTQFHSTVPLNSAPKQGDPLGQREKTLWELAIMKPTRADTLCVLWMSEYLAVETEILAVPTNGLSRCHTLFKAYLNSVLRTKFNEELSLLRNMAAYYYNQGVRELLEKDDETTDAVQQYQSTRFFMKARPYQIRSLK